MRTAKGMSRADIDKWQDLVLRSNDNQRELTRDEAFALGATEKSYKLFRTGQYLMRRAMPVINIGREASGLEPIKGVSGFYMPHEFFGNYSLKVDGKNYVGFNGSSWERQVDALHEAYRLLKEDPNVRIEVVPNYTTHLASMSAADPRSTVGLYRVLKAQEISSGIPEAELLKMYQDGVPPEGFRARMEPRQGKPGFQRRDLFKLYQTYFRQMPNWAAAHTARVKVMRDILPQISERTEPGLRQLLTDWLGVVYGRSTVAEAVIDDMIRRVPVVNKYINPMRPTARASLFARSIVQDLKLSLGSWGVTFSHFAHFPNATLPTLGARGTAMGLRGTFFPTAEERAWLRWGEAHQVYRGFLLDESPGGPFTKLVDRVTEDLPNLPKDFVRNMLRPIGFSERVMRQAAFLGSMHLLKEEGVAGERLVRLATDNLEKKIVPEIGKSAERATLEIAKRVNELVNNRYDRASRPMIYGGPIGGLFGQFKTYIHGLIALQKRLWDLGGRDRLRAVGSFGTMIALGGIAGGVPMFTLIDEMYKKLTGVSPLDELLIHLQHATKPESKVPQVVVRGLPALAGIDMSRRVGFSHLHMERPQDILGPVASTLMDFSQYLYFHDLEHIAPIAPGIANFYTAAQWAHNQMAQDPYHRERLRFTPTAGDVIRRGLGLTPIHQVETTDQLRITSEKQQDYIAQRQQLVDRFLSAIEADDDTALDKAVDAAVEAGIMITPDDISREMAAKETPALERRAKTIPKALRPEYQERVGPFIEQEERRRARTGLHQALQ